MVAQTRKPKLSREAKRFLDHDIRPEWRAAAALGGQTHLVDEIFLFETYPVRLLLLSDVANLRDVEAVVWFWRKWLVKIRPEWKDDLIALRDGLRMIWRSPDHPSADEILNEWLRWLPSHTHLLLYKELGLEKGANCPPIDYAPFYCSVKSGKLVPDVRSLRAMLIHGIFEHSSLMKICTNPDCAAPYFVAKRRDQVLCDAGDCKAQRQREHARNWWNENRAKKSPKKTKTAPKSAKKGKGTDVAKEAR